MSVGRWLLLAGGVGGLLWLGRRRTLLRSPVGNSAPKATPHGAFGAPRIDHAHQGLDLIAEPGSYVLAVGDGAIIRANPGTGGIVRKLQLDSPSAWRHGAEPIEWIVYADLGEALAEPGQHVRKGDPVAIVGNRGFFHFATKARQGNDEVFIDPKRAGFGNEEVHRWLV